ncbi:flagellin [Aeromonas veronii]|nr:flagellin [Aeromonas veronii]
MKDLATQAANGTSSEKDIAAMNAEFGELTKELKNIAGNTTFGGENLLDSKNGKFAKGAITFQIGGSEGERLAVDIGTALKQVVGGAEQSDADKALVKAVDDYKKDTGATSTAAKLKDAQGKLTAFDDNVAKNPPKDDAEKAKNKADREALVTTQDAAQEAFDKGLKPLEEKALAVGSGLDAQILTKGLTSQESAQVAMGKMESFMQDITSVRSALGANINRLEHTVNNLSNMKENTDIAKGRIMDADIATESTNMAKNQMLMQAGMSVLGKSNEMTGMVTMLLR